MPFSTTLRIGTKLMKWSKAEVKIRGRTPQKLIRCGDRTGGFLLKVKKKGRKDTKEIICVPQIHL